MHKTFILCILLYIWRQEMRTTLDLPESLIKEGLKVTHAKTKTALITRALKELIRKNKIVELKKYKGKIDLNIDIDQLRKRR
jgi:hypothetical protein